MKKNLIIYVQVLENTIYLLILRLLSLQNKTIYLYPQCMISRLVFFFSFFFVSSDSLQHAWKSILSIFSIIIHWQAPKRDVSPYTRNLKVLSCYCHLYKCQVGPYEKCCFHLIKVGLDLIVGHVDILYQREWECLIREGQSIG